MNFCSNCGVKLEEGVQFCSGCGSHVGSKAVSINQEKAVNIIQTQPVTMPMAAQAVQNSALQVLGIDEKYCFKDNV